MLHFTFKQCICSCNSNIQLQLQCTCLEKEMPFLLASSDIDLTDLEMCIFEFQRRRRKWHFLSFSLYRIFLINKMRKTG